MDKTTVLKRPVMGNRARKFVLVFAILAALATVVVGFLIWRLAEHRAVPLVVLGCADILLFILARALSRTVYYSAYTYSLSGEGITLWRKNEAVMSLAWTEAEVSLGSYILRGNENNPSVCDRALCFTAKGKMRNPPRFPKRALKGAAGELCIAYSRARLREVFLVCGGDVAGEVTPDGLRLSASDTGQMLDALSKTRTWAQKKADSDAAKAAAGAKRQAREEARQTRREAVQSRGETQRQEAAPGAEPPEAGGEAASLPASPQAQERETPAARGSSLDVDSLGDDEEFL